MVRFFIFLYSSKFYLVRFFTFFEKDKKADQKKKELSKTAWSAWSAFLCCSSKPAWFLTSLFLLAIIFVSRVTIPARSLVAARAQFNCTWMQHQNLECIFATLIDPRFALVSQMPHGTPCWHRGCFHLRLTDNRSRLLLRLRIYCYFLNTQKVVPMLEPLPSIV